MIVVTDSYTFAIVFGGTLALAALFFITYLGLSSHSHSANEKLKSALDAAKKRNVSMTRNRPNEFSQLNVDQFFEFNSQFFHDCLIYGANKHFSPETAIEDTLHYSRELISAYVMTYAHDDQFEESVQLVTDYIRATLKLQLLATAEKDMLRGGLSNPA